MNNDKLNIKDFIYQLLATAECKGIHESADNFHAGCPFHRPRKNTSAFGISFANENAGVYHCYSCHEQGNIFTLIMFLYKCSFREAEKIFIRKVVTAGINLDCISGQLSEMKKYKQDKKEVYRVELPLQATNDEPMWEYLKDRSETKQHNLMDVNFIVSRYGLYFCDIGQFRRRIIMPLRSPNGEYVYFTNRAIDHWAKKNLFPKNSNAMDYVYGLYESLGKKKAILTEGPFDLYQLKSFALRNHIDDFGFIASLGTEIQEERAAIIGQYFDEVYILDDSDEAGFDGERKAYKVLNEYIKTYKITDRVYKGKDPATLNEKQLRHVFAFRPTSRLLVTV